MYLYVKKFNSVIVHSVTMQIVTEWTGFGNRVDNSSKTDWMNYKSWCLKCFEWFIDDKKMLVCVVVFAY